MYSKIPIVSLCGFLGSGKTTLLRRWRTDKVLDDAALIIHDLSDLGLDAELLSKADKLLPAGQIDGRIAALHGNHAHKYLEESLKITLDKIFNIQPQVPLVLTESTGAARPWPLIKALTQDSRFYLKHFIITVDALNLHRDFNDGLTLTTKIKATQDIAISRAAYILAEQITFASVIILTKIDTVPESAIQEQVLNLKKIHPEVTIGLSAHAGLLLDQLDKIPQPDVSLLERKASESGLTDKISIIDEVDFNIFSDPRPFHPKRLHEACQNNLGTGLYRTKGFIWLASRSADALLWQQSGSHISLELKGQWRAEIVKNSNGLLLAEELEGLKKKLTELHPIFGDRCNELTLIGLEKDRNGFLLALEKALCTDSEIEDWLAGKVFDDPWPTTLRSLDLD